MPQPTVLRYPAVPLPLLPEAEGMLPLGQALPLPSDVNAETDVSAPGAPGGGLLDGTIKRVLPYSSTADGRTLPGQIGPYAVLLSQGDNGPIVGVTLPPDATGILANCPPLESACLVLDGMLARIDQWSVGGSLSCANYARAIAHLIGAYQSNLTQQALTTVDGMIFLSRLKTLFMRCIGLFGGRVGEVTTGQSSPLISTAALTALNKALVLNLPTDPLPNLATTQQLLGTISSGVLLP